MSNGRPIVIQTMWRTGGTYLAFALRAQNRVALFYEPLHEDYSKFTQAEWDGFAAEGAHVPRGHPSKSFHYLSDYPFLPGAGVAGHRPEFAFRQFVLAEDGEAPALAAYLRGLMTHAATLGRRPLFKFCRGFLRQRWLRKALDPDTVYLARSPSGMAASYARIGGGGYFYSGYLRVLCENRTDSHFAELHCFVAQAHPEYAAAGEALVASDHLMLTVSQETREDVFVFFWALALAAHADAEVLILDANALGAASAPLRRHIGLEADLSDAVPLDRGPSEIMRFRRPEVYGRLLKSRLDRSRPDVASIPSSLRRQFEALLNAK
jgi:hypothetical protein